MSQTRAISIKKSKSVPKLKNSGKKAVNIPIVANFNSLYFSIFRANQAN